MLLFKKMHCHSPTRSLKCICLIIVVILILELVLFNILIVVSYRLIQGTVDPFVSDSTLSWTDRLAKIKWVQSLVNHGKSGGFVSLMQETLERIYTVETGGNHNMSKINTFHLDVSHSGEFLYIYKHILFRKKFPYAKLVVDVGANDGIMSSNSFNFIQLGWTGILIEPQSSQAEMAAKNVLRYVNPYQETDQKVKILRNVISKKEGYVSFVQKTDIVSMEGHIIYDDDSNEQFQKQIIRVPSMTVRTFVKKYNVPRYFGVLSVDAEGHGNQILHDFIDLGYRPAYIIYEDLHERSTENPEQTKEYMKGNGYKFLTRRGWNLIFSHSRN